MKYIAKSAFKKDNILDKVNKGSDGIEIQLLDPKKEICLLDDYKVENYLRNCNIRSIHMPLDSKTDNNYNIETPCGKEMFEKTLNLAEKFSQFYGQRINVVCHMELSIKQQQEHEMYEEAKQFLIRNLEKYKNIDVNLENVTIRHMGVYDNATLVREINMPNFGTTLDICHALITQSVTGYLTSEGKYENQYYKYETLEKAFEQNNGVCRWIHLNNASNKGQGYGVEKGHSCIFEKDNLNDILTLLKTLNFANSQGIEEICIEVYEDDYLNSQNFVKMVELCKLLKGSENKFFKFIA